MKKLLAVVLILTFTGVAHAHARPGSGHGDSIKKHRVRVRATGDAAPRQFDQHDAVHVGFPAFLPDEAGDGRHSIEIRVICSSKITGYCMEIEYGSVVELIRWEIIEPTGDDKKYASVLVHKLKIVKN